MRSILLISRSKSIKPDIYDKCDFIYCLDGIYYNDNKVINDNLRLHEISNNLIESYSSIIMDIYSNYFKEYFGSYKEFYLSTLGNFRSEFCSGYNTFCNIHLINDLIKELKVDKLILNGFNEEEIDVFKSFNWSINLIFEECNSLKKRRKYITLRNAYYYLNVFVFSLLLKLFNKIKNNNILNNIAVVFPPNHIDKINKQSFFYKAKDLTYWAMLVTDGMHSPTKVKSLMLNFFKIKNKKKFIINDFSIKTLHVLRSFFRSIIINNKIKNIKKKVNIVNPFIGALTSQDINYTMLQLNRLIFLKPSVKESLRNINFKNFHTYLFEYNIGRFLINLAKEKEIKVLGYQHGSISKFKILNINTPYYFNDHTSFNPDTIVCFSKSDQELYKKFKYLASNYKCFQNSEPKFINKNLNDKFRNENLVICGLHDQNRIISFCKKKLNTSDTTIRLHPRAILNERELLNTNFIIDINPNAEESILNHRNIYVTYSTLGIFALKNDKNVSLILLNGLISQSPILGRKHVNYV